MTDNNTHKSVKHCAGDRTRPGSRGFTLIELLVTLAVAAIFIAIAIPSYRAMIDRNTVASQINDLLGDLNYARSEAITRGNIVRVCKSTDGANCTNNGDWTQGWMVYVDDNDDNDRDNNPAEPILGVQPKVAGLTTIAGAGANTANGIRFDPNGFAFGSNGTIVLAGDGIDRNRLLCISTAGRLRSAEADPGQTCADLP